MTKKVRSRFGLESDGTYTEDGQGNWHEVMPAVVGAAGAGLWLTYSSQHASAVQDAYAGQGVVVLLPRDGTNPDGIRVRITAQ
jgi:hypothetical protein